MSHSGSISYAGLEAEKIEAIFGLCHRIAQKAFLDATITCAKELKIDKGIDDFYRMIDELISYPGIVLIEEQIEQLKRK